MRSFTILDWNGICFLLIEPQKILLVFQGPSSIKLSRQFCIFWLRHLKKKSLLANLHLVVYSSLFCISKLVPNCTLHANVCNKIPTAAYSKEKNNFGKGQLRGEEWKCLTLSVPFLLQTVQLETCDGWYASWGGGIKAGKQLLEVLLHELACNAWSGTETDLCTLRGSGGPLVTAGSGDV